MSIGQIKLRKTDKLFTKIVRITFKYTCQRCGRVYREGESLQNLGVSHYWNRNRESTRFLLDNVTLLCSMPCHHLWGGEERDLYKEYMIKRLGQAGCDQLMLAANTYCKRDDIAVEMVLKEWLKELENQL